MKTEDIEMLRFLRNGAQTLRFHTQRRTHPETVGQHSFGVFWLCYYFAERQPSRNLLLAAGAHDLSEQKVGDMPSPAKKDMGQIFQDEFKAREDKLLAQHGLVWELSDEEELILKAADLFDGLLSCLDERAMGNLFIVEAYGNFSDYIEKWIHADGFPKKLHQRCCELHHMLDDNFRAVEGGGRGSLKDVIQKLSETIERKENHG